MVSEQGGSRERQEHRVDSQRMDKEEIVMDIKVMSRMGHYEIYVMGKFYCACEDMREVEEELEELKDQAA